MRSSAPVDAAPPASVLDRLPPDIARSRILTSAQAAEFVGLSLQHFRRLYREGRAPRGVQLGARKLGWKVGALVEWIDAKAPGEAA